jgi:hypothetical protein
MHARIVQMNNNAVYEIPPILKQILSEHKQRVENTVLLPQG